MTDKIRNVFISHVHEDDEYLGKFKSLLAGKGYTVKDGSIHSEKPNNANNPDYIKREILAPRIKWSGALVVLISPKTHQSEWVNWEIEYAHKKNKRIVGVWCQGAKDSDLPEALDKYADTIVGWNGDNIIGAIEGERDLVSKANGSMPETRPIYRVKCQ
jgi:antiphage defense system Thoeris ThsB-like protein